MLYHWIDGRKLYCRTCERVTPYNENPADPRYLRCGHCRRRILGAEVVATYSDDKYDRAPRILLPLDLRAQRERDDIIRRVLHWSPLLGVLGQHTLDEADPWEGLDDLLEELAG